jgi:H+/Cl- antiporter ClcA
MSVEPGISQARYLRLILLGALIGLPAAVVAAGFIALVHTLENWLWTDLPDALGASSPPAYLVLVLPVVGALIVVAARTLLPGDGGHDPLEGLSGAPTPWRYAPGVALAALGTLPFGAVLGPEAPLIALGSAVGGLVTIFVRLDSRSTAVLAAAGSFSAISALFGGPLVAGMLLVEGGLGMGAALVPMLVPGLVAAAVGYLVFVGVGSWGGVAAGALAVPGLPAYQGTHILDLLVGIGVGVATALVLVIVRRLAARVAGLRRGRLGMPGLLVAGGFTVGVLAVLADALGVDSQDVLFSGQASLPALVAESSLGTALVLLVAKTLGYAVSLAVGFRGGPIFPAIFVGIGLGSVAEIVFGVSPTLAVAVGAASGMASQTRLVFASVLFSALLVGTSARDTMPAAVLATVAAWLTVNAVEPLPRAAAKRAA